MTNNRHLNHIVKLTIDVCTNKSKQEFENYIKRELNSLEGIYLLVKDIEFENSILCDCEEFEMPEEVEYE